MDEQSKLDVYKRQGKICLTDYGIDVSNYVLAQFLED